MLKTCSKRDFLWLEDGEGADLSLCERSMKNSQGTLRDLRFGEGESERENLCSWVFENEVVNPHKWGRGGIYSPGAEMAVGAICCVSVGRPSGFGRPKVQMPDVRAKSDVRSVHNEFSIQRLRKRS